MSGGSAAGAAAPPATATDLDGYCPTLLPLPAATATGPELDAPYVVAGTDAACQELCAELSGRGIAICRIRPETAMIHQGEDIPPVIAGLLFVASPDPICANADLFDILQSLSDRLQRRIDSGLPCLLASVLALDGGHGFATGPLRNPDSAALAGLIKTAAWEWPGIGIRLVDPGPAPTPAIADALFRPGPVEIALGAGFPQTVALVPAPLPTTLPQPRIAPADGIVVSGGARGVTAAVARALAERYRCRLLLLGRSPHPEPEPAWLAARADEQEIRRAIALRERLSPRELRDRARAVLAGRAITATCAAIAATGGQARYASVDGRDAAAVAAAIRDFAADGPVRGIVHGAGVLADRLIVDQTAEQWHQVYDTKIDTLDALLAACDPADLRLLIGFSSSTARFGRPGQVAYAMANEVLGKRLLAWQRRHPHCRCIAADWGPWDGGMVTPALAERFAAEGIALIPRSAGADWCVQQADAPAGTPVEQVVLGHGSTLPQELHGDALVIDPDTWPVLRDHILDGRMVLPAAWALDGLIALAGTGPTAPLLIEDFRVYKGLRLEDAASRSLGVQRDTQELRLLHPDGRPAYGARIARPAADMQDKPVPELPALPAIPPGWYPDRRLFHGPLLQLLTGVQADEEHLQADLAPQAQGRAGAVDAVFQALILWSWQQHQAPCLPSGCRRIAIHRSCPDGPLRLRARILRSTPSELQADAWILDPADQPVLSLSAITMTISPDLAAAFATGAGHHDSADSPASV